MQFIPIKTRIVQPPKDDIYPVLDKYLPSLQEGDVLLITSKIISIHQGRCVKTDEVDNKDELIKKEAEIFEQPEVEDNVKKTEEEKKVSEKKEDLSKDEINDLIFGREL